MGFCLWLAAWMAATPALVTGVSCEDWNTKAFFKRTGVADVSRCLKTKSPNVRDEYGWTPLQLAARYSKIPAIVTALLDAEADPAARDKEGKTPWDLITADSSLKGTDVYWRLNEGQFN